MSANDPMIRVDGVTKSFSTEEGDLPAIDEISFSAFEGDFACIVGPSGCGKSTLFNIMTGLLLPDRGSVLLDGKSITGKTGLLGYMPQKDLLFPWRTVIDNSILGLELNDVSRDVAYEQARSLFDVFGLSGFENYYPTALSGGMRQRVSLARTFLFGAEVMLLDEPFGALDALTRTVMQAWLLEVWEKLEHTILFITHDVEEAVFLSDRILVLSARPARLLLDVDVELPRPRKPEHRTSTPALELRERILTSLEGEARRSFSQQAVAS